MKSKTIIVAIALLLTLMPAAAFADDDFSDEVVASEEAETEAENIQPIDGTVPAETSGQADESISEIADNPDEATETDTPEAEDDPNTCPESVEPVAEESPLPKEDDSSSCENVGEDASDVDSRYIEAAIRVSNAVASRQDYVDLYDLMVEEDTLDEALIIEGALSSDLEEYSLLVDDADAVIAMMLTYIDEADEADENTETSSPEKHYSNPANEDHPEQVVHTICIEYSDQSPVVETDEHCSVPAEAPGPEADETGAEEQSEAFMLLAVLLTALVKLIGGMI